MVTSFFDIHAHTCYSNIRLLDCINRPKELIKRAIEIGLEGMSITDHEALCAHMIVNKFAKELRETNPNFTIALGNEIYLTDTRESNQKYYHFILLAKDAIGYRALKELSSIAWYNVYVDRRMERVPTLKTELMDVMKKYKGHVIATTACMGGELSTNLLGMAVAQKVNDIDMAQIYYNNACEFVNFCINVFGKDDFYIECAPAAKADQIMVNQKLLKVAEAFNLKLVVGTDAHYLKKEDRFVHKSYLNSKGGEREVDEFYEYAYLQSPEEVRNNLFKSFENHEIIDQIFNNSLEIKNKITFYSLEKHQHIPEVKVKDYPKQGYLEFFGGLFDGYNDQLDEFYNEYPILTELFDSDNVQERYWVNQCFEALIDKGIGLKQEYIKRLEEEARVKRVIGEKLQTCMFAYPNTLQHYIDLFWKCGSTVGAGRGSACSGLNHYLLGITQLDPIKWELPFWRYLNDERVELGDIDLDLAPSKLPKIFKSIRDERGEFGLVQVCTFGTEGTKSAILTACRGYRSEEYPDGIDVDDAQYISSLVPQERGFLWSLNDLIYGDPDKGRTPQKQFINTVNQYPGLLDIMFGIEGMVCRRGIHASGVILFDNDSIFDEAAIMRAPNGNLTTQWDLHDQEAAGSVKYDFLLTAVQDIIIKTIDLLQADEVIDPKLNLREVYDKYLHPNILPQDDEKMWKALAENKVIGCFQFDGSVGQQAAKKIKPHNPLEMADANGLMRLMASEPGAEMPLEKYVRYKNNINLWYNEMTKNGLTKEEQKIIEPYFKTSYGVPPSQEQLMKMLMDENICGFTLAEANAARKIVGKKQMSKIPALRQQVLDKAKSPALGKYIWTYGAGPQMGYSFSIIHALAYSFIGMQTLYLATNFNPIYWNTAYLIVNSGSLEDEEEEVDKQESTSYTKLAKAIGQIRSAGIKVSLADINKSFFGFLPDVENNQILFGMKGMLNVGDDLVETIIEKRPYISPRDFLNKVQPNKQAMISLIKGGAFDNMMDRKTCMAWYIWEVCDKKKRITLQNMPGLMKYKLVPEDTEDRVMARRVYEFNRYLKAIAIPANKNKPYFVLDDRAINFLTSIGKEELICQNGNLFCVLKTDWDKIYQSWMDVFRYWMSDNQEYILDALNKSIFLEDWNKYAKGNISSWEMEALCFYYHPHELDGVDMHKYGFANFFDLPEQPEIDRSFWKGNKQINMYKLAKICGTCIAKNKLKSTVTLLTTTGVVDVKFRKEYFALFDKQISARGDDGVKHIVEKSWFNRGSMIIVQGIRLDDMFVAKKYASSGGHQLYKIDEVIGDEIKIRTTRAQGDEEEEE